ncbi:MAG: sulfur carrier protein ThiS [Thermoanaerobaculia bacterium]
MTATPGAALAIRLNGEPHLLPESMSLRALVDSVGCDPASVAVELNGVIVRRARLVETTIVDGDVVEIVRFVQGG